MAGSCSSALDRARRPLAACIASVFALNAPAALANIVIVTNCQDAGADSLRAAVAAANPGDTVSVASLPLMCNSVITLTSGAIPILQAGLTIEGPAGRITIAHGGAGSDRVFNHTGTGTLYLNYLNIVLGNPYSMSNDVYGGCVYSKGSVTLNHSGVFNCTADSKLNSGGGGIAATNVRLNYSAVNYNSLGAKAFFGTGGGVRVRNGGVFAAKYSTLSGNMSDAVVSRGGGAMVYGSAIVAHSTISGNSAREFGGLGIHGVSANFLTIAESTISGNSVQQYTGGVNSDVGTVTVQNSTIAFNTAVLGKSNDEYLSAGLNLEASTVTATLQSVLLSGNTYGAAVENDFTAGQGVTVGGANNFVRASTDPLPPTGLVFGQCPFLGKLRNNGGPVKTHALLSGSHAIDAGNNLANIPFDTHPYPQDQRGPPYPRVSGPQADAGAYEVDQDDIVYNSGFDDCQGTP